MWMMQDAIDREQAQYDEIEATSRSSWKRKRQIKKVVYFYEIALASENSRTGRPIPKKIVAKFEATENEKITTSTS